MIRFLLWIVYCIVASTTMQLTAHRQEESNDITALTERICDLLIYGYSKDEIVALFNEQQESPYDIQLVIAKIDQLLQEQHSKEDVIHIIINNQESDDFWGREKEHYQYCGQFFEILK